ncbi:MAG: hypothetical protein ACXWX4_07180 [Actinomycetota bacterium]
MTVRLRTLVRPPTDARLRSWGAKGAPVAVFLALSVGAASPGPVIPPSGTWVVTRINAEVLEELDPGLTRAFLGTPDTIALGGYGDAVPAMGWASLAAFEFDVGAGLVPDNVRIVMYDPEAWEHTPLDEQLDPAGAMAGFAALARAHGYLVLMTPHPSLVTVPGAACPMRTDESATAAFLRCGLVAAAAVHADVVDVQLQSLQRNPARYREAIAEAARQARAANPDVQVLAHLTTAMAPDPTVLYAAWHSVQPVVDGQYLGVPGGRRATVALAFMRMLSVGVERRR